jgi:hypothetical protein
MTDPGGKQADAAHPPPGPSLARVSGLAACPPAAVGRLHLLNDLTACVGAFQSYQHEHGVAGSGESGPRVDRVDATAVPGRVLALSPAAHVRR